MIPADTITPCRDRGDLFFDEQHPGRVAAAKALCSTCPLSGPCGSYALAHDVCGVWASTTTDERQATRRRAGIVAVEIVTFPQRSRVAS